MHSGEWLSGKRMIHWQLQGLSASDFGVTCHHPEIQGKGEQSGAAVDPLGAEAVSYTLALQC